MAATLTGAGLGDAFVDAAACGDHDGVRELLEDASTPAEAVNGLDKDGRSALHYACLNDDVRLLSMMLGDPRTNVDLRTPKGDSCLHLGALYASLQALKALFEDERGIKLLDEQNQWGETALHLCAGSGDKGAGKAAALLLEAGASLLITDKWSRGPVDVAHDNGENPLVSVFQDWLAKQPEDLRAKVTEQSKACVAAKTAPVQISEGAKKKHANVFADLGAGLKALKKTTVTEKTMFSKLEGRISLGKKGHDAKSTGKVLSKMIDFPGDKDEIAAHLEDSTIDPGGADAYGLTALHKFSSWNKVELLDLLIPKLSKDQLNQQDPEGKTALHWACEMASVAAVSRLVACPDIDKEAKDNKGRTPLDILNSGSGNIVERLKRALNA